MRPFLTVESIVDSSGFPVSGSVIFRIKGTTTLASITDVNGVSIQNPQPLLNGKTASQVFLPDQDIHYIVLDTDGAQVSTGYDLYNVFHVATQGSDIPAFSSVSAMTAVAGLSDGDIVTLLGYYAKGDKPAVNYVFHSTVPSGVADDGGSVIFHSTSGYFTLQEPSTVDVSIWGVFGYDSYADAMLPQNTKTAQIIAGNTYALSVGKSLVFQKNKYYAVAANASGYTCENGILVANTAVSVTVKSSTTKVFNNSDYNGRFTINNELVRASQIVTTQYQTYVRCKTFIMDVLKEVDLENCVVYVRVDLAYTTQHTWKNVTIFGSHCIVNTFLKIQNSFIDPTVIDNDLATSSYISIFSDCRTDSSLWSDQEKWTAFADTLSHKEVYTELTASTTHAGTLDATSVSVTGNASVGGTLAVTGVTTLGTVNATSGTFTEGIQTPQGVRSAYLLPLISVQQNFDLMTLSYPKGTILVLLSTAASTISVALDSHSHISTLKPGEARMFINCGVYDASLPTDPAAWRAITES